MNRLVIAEEHFRRHGFAVQFFNEAEAVQAAFRERLTQYASVGFGGSATLRQLALDEIAREAGIPFFDHWQPGIDKTEDRRRRLEQGRAELFVTSANAATTDGRLVLRDGIGNRLAAAVFGPKHVLFAVGENKLTDNLEQALQRIREIAAPKRAAQLKTATPCVETGECRDCQSPQRICRATLIIERPSMGMTAEVWLLAGAWGL